MKTKIKNKTKVKAVSRKKKTVKRKTIVKAASKKSKHYHPSYLGLMVAGILLLEGLLFSVATPEDWKYGAQILDLRPAVAEIAADAAEMFSPMVELTYSVNEFYVIAADETLPLLDLSGALTAVGDIYTAIDSFYGQASIAMADLLGVPDQSYYGNIAGASIQQ